MALDPSLSMLEVCRDRIRKEVYFVNTEISFDLDSVEFPFMLKNWESIQELIGDTPESLADLPMQLRELLSVIPPAKTEDLILQSGIRYPVRFFQALMICAW